MTFQYFVVVDPAGHAGLAATKRTVVESEVTEHGGRLISVRAPNAFIARKAAITLWQEISSGGTLH